MNEGIKRGRSKAASRQWVELVEWVPEIEAEATFLVRVADMLLREEENEAAADAIARATRSETPLAGKIGLLAFRMAGQLDRALARAVAEAMLTSSELSDRERADLQAKLRKLPGAMAADVSEVGERRAQRGETTDALPVARPKLEKFTGLRAVPHDQVVEGTGAGEPVVPTADPSEIDPGALDPAALSAGDADTEEARASSFAASDDVSQLDPHALDAGALGAEVGDSENAEAQDAESWNSPGVVAGFGEDDGSRLVRRVLPLAASEDALGDDALDELDDDELDDDDFDLGELRRPLRVVATVPLALGADAISLDTEERGKSKLRFDRIEAVAVGAVRGLGPKAGGDRRSRRQLARSARRAAARAAAAQRSLRSAASWFRVRRNGVAALRTMIATLVDASRATSLPNADAVRGEPFAVNADLATYHREALQAEDEAT